MFLNSRLTFRQKYFATLACNFDANAWIDSVCQDCVCFSCSGCTEQFLNLPGKTPLDGLRFTVLFAVFHFFSSVVGRGSRSHDVSGD